MVYITLQQIIYYIIIIFSRTPSNVVMLKIKKPTSAMILHELHLLNIDMMQTYTAQAGTSDFNHPTHKNADAPL